MTLCHWAVVFPKELEEALGLEVDVEAFVCCLRA